MRAIERLDRPGDGVRGSHAKEDKPAALPDRGGDLGGGILVVLEGSERVPVLARHFAVDRKQAGGAGSFSSHHYPFTPPLVRPEISARCMTRPISTGGKAASTPAVAISP